jgi:hypothetical protein
VLVVYEGMKGNSSGFVESWRNSHRILKNIQKLSIRLCVVPNGQLPLVDPVLALHNFSPPDQLYASLPGIWPDDIPVQQQASQSPRPLLICGI